MSRPRATFSRNGITSAALSGPPKPTTSKASKDSLIRLLGCRSARIRATFHPLCDNRRVPGPHMQRRAFLSSVPAGFAAAATAGGRAQTVPAFPDGYRDAASRLIGAALTHDGGWKKLAYLCDRIGHRIAGSASLERAIEWAAAEMRREGLENVQTPPVKVPHWVRGAESARLVAPLDAPVFLLGLGGSIATPPEGLTADLVAVSSFDELEALGADQVRGRIVLYNVPWQGYGRTVQYRTNGAIRAARLGAVA